MGRRKLILAVAGLVSLVAIVVAIVLARQPMEPEARFQQALNSLNNGESEGISEAFAALEADPRYEEHAALLSGVLALRSGDPARALRRILTVNPKGPLRQEALLYAAEALFQTGELYQAESLLRDLIAEQPDHAEARRWLGTIYYDLGAFSAAIGQLEELIRLDPDDFRPHRLMGIMRRDFGEEELAIPSYQRALELNPPREIAEDIRQELGRALIAVKQHEEAIRILSEDLPDDPTDLASRNIVIATCQRELGETAEARRLLNAALKEGINKPETALLDAELSTDEGDNEQALEILTAAVAEFPFHAEIRYAYAMQLQRTGDSVMAEQQLEEWQKLTDLATQRTELNVKAINEPYNPDVRDELADVSERLGQFELAEMWRNAARALRSGGSLPATSPERANDVESGEPESQD